MEIIQKFKKNEKGAITVMVLTSMLFMLVVITASYIGISNKSINQNRKVSKISKQYQVTDEDMEQEYQEAINSLNVKDYVKVGQYVDYEPTKIDVSRTQAVDSSKLTYTSPTGKYSEDVGIITHGNGYTSGEDGGGQTFTAKANDGTETGVRWRVLSVSDNKIELISEKPVLKDRIDQENGKFVLQGGIGYLYAEQELNEICKIYGYGYGADTTARAKYTMGGPEDEEFQQIKTIGEPSGARSITIDDLNKLAGIYYDKKDDKMKYSDGEVINASYGDETNPTVEVYYPMLNSSNTSEPGQSSTTKLGFKYTMYTWNSSKITDPDIQSMLFNGSYWLANRSILTGSTGVTFSARSVVMNTTRAEDLARGYNSSLKQYTNKNFAVRPIVTLKADVIDLETDYSKDEVWRLK